MAKKFILVLTFLIHGYFGYAQIQRTFTHRIIDHAPPDNIWIKSTGDFNNDGHLDIMIGGHNGRTQDFIIWYQNPGITNGKWIKHVVYEGGDAFGFEGGVNGDLDGDIDLVMGSYWQHKLFWLENQGDGISKWKLHELGTPKSGTTYLYDFDGDGKLDIVTRASQKYSGEVGKDVWIWRQNNIAS